MPQNFCATFVRTFTLPIPPLLLEPGSTPTLCCSAGSKLSTSLGTGSSSPNTTSGFWDFLNLQLRLGHRRDPGHLVEADHHLVKVRGTQCHWPTLGSSASNFCHNSLGLQPSLQLHSCLTPFCKASILLPQHFGCGRYLTKNLFCLVFHPEHSPVLLPGI